MNTLAALSGSTGKVSVVLPSGRTARISSMAVRFATASESRVCSGVLARTYISKPLVGVGDESLFGELAIVRLLAADRWSAVWADTFHGQKFWGGMPHVTSPVALPPRVRALDDPIPDIKGSAAGCFDVIAWKGERVIFLDYKGAKDRPNRNELRWIDAALEAGAREEDLFFVGA